MKRTLLLISLVLSGCAEDDPATFVSGSQDAQAARETYDVSGRDSYGRYTGKAVLYRDDLGVSRFVRAVDYGPDVLVEGDRRLAWGVSGTWTKQIDGLSLAYELTVADFIVKRAGIVRDEAARAPRKLTAALARRNDGFTGTFADGSSGTREEEWTPAAASVAPQSLLDLARPELRPAHSALEPVAKAALFELYKSFHVLPEVAPYRERPEFKAAIALVEHDRAQLGFYRKNPQVVQVIDKPLDAVAIQEARARADAFRFTLAKKAQIADAAQALLVEPKTGVLLDGRLNGVNRPAGDGALWTAMDLAAQRYRYEVTGSPEALARFRRGVEAMLLHLEAVPQKNLFARTLRPKGATPPVAPWIAGVGVYAPLEWLSGGNNDMIKGVFYAYALGWKAFCAAPGDPLCPRLTAAAKRLADDIDEAKKPLNRVIANWLAAAMTKGFDQLKYRAIAEAGWAVATPLIGVGTVFTEQGVADWSGVNLTFVTHDTIRVLSEIRTLAVDTSALKSAAKTIAQRMAPYPMPLWSFHLAALGTPEAARSASGKMLLEEMAVPKTDADVDHRIARSFVVSPYPALPWKNDWTTNPGRVQSLVARSLFKRSPDGNQWKANPFAFRGALVGEIPYTDYLFAYWYGRRFGALTPQD